VLNLGNSKIISVHDSTARQIIRDPHFHGDVQVTPPPLLCPVNAETRFKTEQVVAPPPPRGSV